MHRATCLSFLLLVACGKSTIDDDPSGPAPTITTTPITTAQRQALDGLREGDELGATRVTRILPVERGTMQVIVESKGEQGAFDICLFSDQAPSPPVRTDKYAVYIANPGKEGKPLSVDVLMPAAEALAVRLRKVEGKVPPPPGVTTYATEKKP